MATRTAAQKVYYKLAAWEGILAGCRRHTWARDRDCGFGGEDKCMAEFVKVAIMNEIAPGQARLVNIKGKEIALFNIEGTFFALENACTHEEGPLAEGEIEGHEVTCPWHALATDDYLTGNFGQQRLPLPQPRTNELPLSLVIVNFPD